MHIIFGKEVADELREKYTVLELESFDVGDGLKSTAYCVLNAENVNLSEMPDMPRLCKLHQALIDALHAEKFDTVTELIGHLKGKFNGEMDSFYDILAERISKIS